MKTYEKYEFLDSGDLKPNEIINYGGNYLQVKNQTKYDSCSNCFFNNNKFGYQCFEHVICIGDDLSYKYIELTEIERLILLEDEKNEYEKNNRRS